MQSNDCKFGFNVEYEIDELKSGWFSSLCKIKQMEFHITRLKEKLQLVANKF